MFKYIIKKYYINEVIYGEKKEEKLNLILI